MYQNFIYFVLNTFSHWIRALDKELDSLSIHCRALKNADKIYTIFLSFTKNHTLLRFNNLTELTVLDNPSIKDRFSLVLLLTSIEFSSKLSILVPINGLNIPSISSIYPNSSWSEREARDMFGLFFTNNTDLRRLLTDYGFEGFPLRKDFPLTGYLEVRYDDEFQRIVYEPVELAQEFRIFQLSSPWENKN